MSNINSYIKQYILKDYGDVDTSRCIIDCSLGVDASPIPDIVMDRIRHIDATELKDYPHNHKLIKSVTDKIISRYIKYMPTLSYDNIIYGCGSYDILCNLNLLYAGRNSKVMGHAPQFTAYIDHVNCIGASYVSYRFPKEDNYKLNADDFAAMIRSERPSLICCENPNNPTGQIIDIEDMRKLIDAASDIDAAIVFDEAYGDFIDESRYSAISLIEYAIEKDVDIFVIRSFSKGYGIAGARIGYAIGPAHAMSELHKLITPFNCNSMAYHVADALLDISDRYIEDVRRRTRDINEKLYSHIKEQGIYKIAHTSIDTPICTLYVDDPDVDLCKEMAQKGICTVSCTTYDNLGSNAVRIMIPYDAKKLIDII